MSKIKGNKSYFARTIFTVTNFVVSFFLMIQSLHNHTTTSDGKLTYTELLQEASKRNFSVIAFTDHDSLPPLHIVEELAKPQWAKDFPTKYIWGIEMTSSPPKETHIRCSDFHIVGLFVDPTNKELREYCQIAQKRRQDRMSFIVKGLQKLNFTITEEMCLEQSGGESVGRPHIVRALASVPSNAAVLEGIVQQFVSAREKDSTLSSRFPEFDSSSLWDKCYALFLSKSAWMSGVYKEMDVPDIAECSRLIHGAGGIVILAHYFTISRVVSLSMVEEWLDSGILDGAETVYNLGKGSSVGAKGEKENAAAVTVRKQRIEEQNQLKELLQKKKKLWRIGGGDIHTIEMMEEYVHSENAQNSEGMAEALIPLLPSYVNVKKTSSLLS